MLNLHVTPLLTLWLLQREMKGLNLKTAFAFIAVASGFGLIFALSNFLERNRPALPDGYEDADLAVQGKHLKGFVLGADGLFADWYWMQSLQYLGDKIEKSKSDYINVEDLGSLNPRLLYPYLENATEFDPHFLPSYSFGATILPAVDPEKAILLIEKGIANNPDKFRLYQYLGYIYWKLGKYDQAAEVYQRGAKLADAPPFMKLMAASMTNEAGSPETARAMYQQMYEQAEDQQTRNNAEYRLMEFDTVEELKAIQAVLKTYSEKKGECPQSLSEILPQLSSVKLPFGKDFHINATGNLTDPSGSPYIFDRSSCQAVIDPQRQKTAK
jgi:tetratricopeptide (TPR) repeat protein